MANKRFLKRAIKSICTEIFAECVAASVYGTETTKDNGEALLFSIIRLQNDFISRISHPEPGLAPKLYFKKLREGFSAEANDIIDQINNL